MKHDRIGKALSVERAELRKGGDLGVQRLGANDRDPARRGAFDGVNLAGGMLC